VGRQEWANRSNGLGVRAIDSTRSGPYGNYGPVLRSLARRRPSVDIQLFYKNRQQFPPEELAKYAGKYVAWSPDGTHILACDEDELSLANAIRAGGHSSAEVLISYVPVEDEILLGGLEIAD
jgi:hypothetical protein